MNQPRLIRSTLLVFAISPSLFAGNHFKEMEECTLIYSETKSEGPITTGLGDSYLNIRNMHKLVTKVSGELIFFYGNNSITITSNIEGQNEIIDTFQDCSEVPD